MSDEEIVFTVDSYHDGPLEGVANFHGAPHFYKRVFDEKLDEYSDTYLLVAINEDIFRAALENWEIFSRWRRDFDSGVASRETQPANAADKSKFEETKKVLVEAIASHQDRVIRAEGKFYFLGSHETPSDVLKQWRVTWR